MSECLKSNKLILILVVGTLLTSSASMPLANAQPTPTSLTIAVPSPPLGEPFWCACTIEANLKDENGNPLPNMDIGFYVCGTEKIGTAKTDSNGLASLTSTLRAGAMPESTWKISAYFSGTTSYAPSSSEYVDIFIADHTPYLVGGGLVALAIIVVVGYIVVRRRKKHQ